MQILVSFTFLLAASVAGISTETYRNTLYRRRRSVRVQTDANLMCNERGCPTDRKACVFACREHDQCQSIDFRSQDGRCVRNTNHVQQFGTLVTEDSEWENYSPVVSDVRDNDWILVFRTQIDIDNSAAGLMTDFWNSNVTHDGNNLSELRPECFAIVSTNCTTFYRSQWLDNWPSERIDQVRLTLYGNGSSVVNLTFNGTGSDRESWFQSSRLLSSPWTDLANANPRYFSLRGNLSRSFYISMSDYNNCTNLGWLIVLKPSTRCSFDKETQTRLSNGTTSFHSPQFLYAHGTNYTNFNTRIYGKAEVMGIFIKLR